MLRIAQCDDDPRMHRVLSDALQAFSDKHRLSYELISFHTAKELLEAPFDYNLLFLDLLLEDGADGIEVGRQLRRMGNNALFVITTIQAERSLEGYRAGVLRYLVKPIDEEAFEEAMLAVLDHYRMNRRILPVKFNQKVRFIDFSEIVMVESYLRRRFVWTAGGKYQTSEQWASICGHFEGEPDFFMPQKYYIINLHHVRAVSRTDVSMEGGFIINFAKGRYAAFSEQFSAYLSRTAGIGREDGGYAASEQKRVLRT